MYTSSIPLNENNKSKKSDLTNHKIPSRPTTPLRSSSRISQRELGKNSISGLSIEVLEPAFAELSDSMADLEANFMHLQLMNDSISRFNENFSSFLHGLHMNAFCVDFPEAPIPESFLRIPEYHEDQTVTPDQNHVDPELDTTFMTTDTSFVENPQTASKNYTKTSLGTTNTQKSFNRGGSGAWGRTTGRGGSRGSQGSGIARVVKPRGTKNL